MAAGLVLVVAAVFVVNQTAQVVALASTVSPAFGRAVLIALLCVYAGVVLVPVVLFFRLPRALARPATSSPRTSRCISRGSGSGWPGIPSWPATPCRRVTAPRWTRRSGDWMSGPTS